MPVNYDAIDEDEQERVRKHAEMIFAATISDYRRNEHPDRWDIAYEACYRDSLRYAVKFLIDFERLWCEKVRENSEEEEEQ